MKKIMLLVFFIYSSSGLAMHRVAGTCVAVFPVAVPLAYYCSKTPKEVETRDNMRRGFMEGAFCAAIAPHFALVSILEDSVTLLTGNKPDHKTDSGRDSKFEKAMIVGEVAGVSLWASVPLGFVVASKMKKNPQVAQNALKTLQKSALIMRRNPNKLNEIIKR